MEKNKKNALFFILIMVILICGMIIVFNQNKNTFKIYQLKLEEQAGGCAYAISVNEDEKLIMIDSGYQSDADYIKTFIENHGGKVDSWFITHPHFDHVGGLIQILAEQEQAEKEQREWSLEIDKIYYAPFTKEFFTDAKEGKNLEELNKAVLINEFEYYKERSIENRERGKKYSEFFPVELGQELSLDELDVVCLSGFNPNIYDVNANSLVLRLQLNSESFMITGDITDISIQNMMAYWGEDNKIWSADYIQIPHHGYMAGISNDLLYQMVRPKIAFLDCSKQEFEGNAVSIQDHIKMLEPYNITIKYRFDGDNSIEIK